MLISAVSCKAASRCFKASFNSLLFCLNLSLSSSNSLKIAATVGKTKKPRISQSKPFVIDFFRLKLVDFSIVRRDISFPVLPTMVPADRRPSSLRCPLGVSLKFEFRLLIELQSPIRIQVRFR